jgi:hypothetical protein
MAENDPQRLEQARNLRPRQENSSYLKHTEAQWIDFQGSRYYTTEVLST